MFVLIHHQNHRGAYHNTNLLIGFQVKQREEGDDVDSKKVMNPGKVKILTKSSKLPQCTDDAKVIGLEAIKLFYAFQINPSDVRGMGINIDNLTDGNEEKSEKIFFILLCYSFFNSIIK